MSAKTDALDEVITLMRSAGLTLDDVARALKPEAREEKSSGMLTKILGYIGGIFIFSGLAAFVGMHWDTIGPAGRVMLTLGVGFCVFLMGVTASRDARLARAATPLFIIAALMEPGGIIVALKEFSRGGDPAHGILFMNFVMLLQQGLAFVGLRRTFLALTTIFFGTCAVVVAMDLMDVDDNLIGFTVGVSLTAIGWALGKSAHRPIAGLAYFIGSALFMGVMWDWLENSMLEVLILGLSCGLIALSTAARSRALLTVGTLSMLAYIGYFTAEHFMDNDLWPFTLMGVGVLMIGLSALAVRINRKYIASA